MIGFISKIFGGSKSEKDVKTVMPQVARINQHFTAFQSLTNDELRGKTVQFRQRIAEHLKDINAAIAETESRAESLSFEDLDGKDAIYQEADKLKKDRDKKIEEVLNEILPEAFAVVKETARRFKENEELVSAATELDRELAVTKNHIRIIAPYNAQVHELVERIPDVAIGTVDKFQGQEAAVIIFSMTTSTPQDAPRGMEFLYSLNRLNVAVSRAKSIFILVANPKLFQPGCNNPEQMRLANAFCR